ncbi:MAG: hypothetical protein BYD32DRAFT_449288 [Podila humilis]|nr:MAG: hypothetical protein BYD32DRAFT_449288 [Podila humilis]
MSQSSKAANHRHSGNYNKVPSKLPFILPEMTFISLGHARFQEEDKSTWEPTPEMFTLLLQSLGVLSAEQPANTHTAQQHLVTIAIAQQLNLSPTYRQRKQSLGLSQNNSSQFFESEDPLSQQYVLTTSDVEHKYLCKIFTGTEIFRHSAVIALPGRRLDSMKRLVQTAIENELGAIEWVRTECTSIKTPEILGYGYHLGCVPEMSEWLDRFGILGFILTSFPRSGIVYRGPGEGSPPLESSAKRHLCDQIAKDGKIFKPFGIRSRFDLILGRMQEKISGSPSPYTQASTTSSSTTFSEFDLGDMARSATKKKSQIAVSFHLSVSSSEQNTETSTSASPDHDPSVYCSSEAPLGGRICSLGSNGARADDRTSWPTHFVHPGAIYNSVAEYEQARLKNALVALGRLDASLDSDCLFPEALLALLPRILRLANNERLFTHQEQAANNDGSASGLSTNQETIFDGVPIVFTHTDLSPSSFIVEPSTGDLLGLINLQYAGFFPAYTEPIRQIFVDIPAPTLAFLNSDPSEQEEDSDAEDEATRRRKSFKGLVGSIIRRSSGSRCKHPSPEDTATRTSSRGKGKAITKQARVIVPFSRTGGHPFPFVAINHFKTVDLLFATPKSMIFTKETRRAWREGTRVALEKARSLSETKRSSSHSVSWIKRRSTIENKSVTATDSGKGSQASELKELKTNDDPQEPQKVSRHLIIRKALQLCISSWKHFLCSLREYEIQWVDRQTRVRLSAQILQDHCNSYRHYMQDVTSDSGAHKRRASVCSSTSVSLPLSNFEAVASLTVVKSDKDATFIRPPSTVSTYSAVIVSNTKAASARDSSSSLVPTTKSASLSTQKDSDRIEHGYGPVLEAFVSITKTFQNLVVALEAGARVLTPEQFLRKIEAKASRKVQSSMLQGGKVSIDRKAEQAHETDTTEEQKRQLQLYRMNMAASAISSSAPPAVPQSKPKRGRVRRLLKSMFNSKRPELISKPAPYQPPTRTSEDNILYMGPERDPLPSELPSHLVFVAPPPKKKPPAFTSLSHSSVTSLRLVDTLSQNSSFLSVVDTMDDGDTCSYNSDDTDEIRHQIASPPVVISGGSHYYGANKPPSMGAIAADIPVYGLRLSARDGAKTLYESERERLEEEERSFWAEFEEEEDKEIQQESGRGRRRGGRVAVLDLEDLEANVRILEEFLTKGNARVQE